MKPKVHKHTKTTNNVCKKTITFLTILFCLGAKAQIINPGFETWTTDTYVPAMNPNSGNGSTGWWDYNIFNSSFVGSSPISVFRCDTAHAGSYSARVETVVYTTTSWNIYKALGIPYIGHNYLDTIGILYNGTVNETAATSSPGFPFTQKLTQFSFYYQYKPNGVDTAECRVSIVKSHSVIAGGIFKTSVATGVSGWQLATINMVYLDTLTPDTMYVLFSSSSLDKKPKPGSILWIDDIGATLSTGIKQVIPMNYEPLSIYPNPSTGMFTVGTNTTEKQTLQVYDVNGKIVLSQLVTGKTLIDGGLLSEGIYNVCIIGSTGILNKRLVITHN